MEQHESIADDRKGKHLTKDERVVIEVMLRAGTPVRSITSALSRHLRTIEREIARGSVEHRDSEWRVKMVYSSDRGQAVHELNATAKGPELKLGTNHKLAEYIGERISKRKESPEILIEVAALPDCIP